MSALTKALANGQQACDVFGSIARTAYNAKARKEFATSRDIVANGLKRKSWEGECTKSFTAAYDRLRYGIITLVDGDDALQYVHEKGIECDFNGRNRYGKQLWSIDTILGKKQGKYDQSHYAARLWDHLINCDEIETKYALTARELSTTIGASKDKAIGVTQCYAMLHALDLIGAGKRTMAGSNGWQASRVDLEANSAYVETLNAAIRAKNA